MGIAMVSLPSTISADIAGIWVAFFSRWQRYRCQQGWGWGNPAESYARGNAITYNRVDRANQRLAGQNFDSKRPELWRIPGEFWPIFG